MLENPGISRDLCKDNARPECIMKRPYSTPLSYKKCLSGF